MRILSSAVILAMVTLGAGCAEKTSTATTKPPAQPAPAAAPATPAAAPATAGRAGAPAAAPAAAPAGRAAGAAPAAAAGRAGGAGAPVTIADHAATMKQIAASNAALGKVLKGGDLMAAATEAGNLANHFATIERFYTQRNKPDAVKLAQTARTGAADAAAAAKAGDAMKAQMGAGSVGGTCTQCHKMYREGDGQTGYRFNAASGITPP